MTLTTVRIPTPLRSFTAGRTSVEVRATSVREALDVLGAEAPELRARILDERGAPQPFVNLFLGSRNVRELDGLETRLEEGAVLSILPAVAGGAR